MNRTRPKTRDRGAVLPMIALLLPVLMLMTAFAVDLGQQRSTRRDMQAAADVIALDMSRLADGRPLSEIQVGSGVHPPAETALVASAGRNDVDRAQLTLDWGIWSEATGYQSINGVGSLVPNAAKIVATESTDYFFQPGGGSVTREAVAIYGAEPFAGFSVGSFGLAMSTSQSRLLDDLLSPYVDDDNPVLQDDPVELDAVSYEGLAGADIPLGDLAPAFNAGTPRELLDAEMPLDDFMLAYANVLRNDGRAAEAELVEESISAEMGDFTVDVSDYVTAESGAEDAAMGATVDLPTIIQGAVFQAQCSPNPQGFDQCNAINIPALTATFPMTSATGSLKLIESPRYWYGPVGSGVNTGQIRATLGGVAGARQAGTCTPNLLAGVTCLLNGILARTVDAVVTVNAVVTMAGGRTTISDIDCADPAALGLLLRSNTDLYDVDLDITVQFGTRGILGGALGTVLGSLNFSGQTTQSNGIDDVQFTVAPDVLGQTQKQTGAGNFGLAPVSLTTSGSTGVLSGLASLGINYTTGSVLSSLVNPLLQDIDNRVLTPLGDILGLNVSGSDLIAQAIDCNPGFVELVE